MKLPTLSNPVKTRSDGQKVVGGLTGSEWAVTIFALVALWIVQACIFTGLLAAATSVRDAGALYMRPGRDVCVFGEPECARVNPVLTS